MNIRTLALIILTTISSDIWAMAQSKQKTQIPPKESSVNANSAKDSLVGEDRWAVELFQRDYKIEYYDSYKGLVVVSDNDTYKYGCDTVINVLSPISELKEILKKGVFHPGVIDASFKYRRIFKIKLLKESTTPIVRDTLTKKVFYNITRTDSITIENFEELKFLEKTPTRKRFRFWLIRKGLGYPSACFIELTNEKATLQTDMVTFINGSKLTFFEEGWIVI